MAGRERGGEGGAVSGQGADEVFGPDGPGRGEALCRKGGPGVVFPVVAPVAAGEESDDGTDGSLGPETELRPGGARDRRDRQRVREGGPGRPGRGAQPDLPVSIGRRFDGWDLFGTGEVDRDRLPPRGGLPLPVAPLELDDDAAAGAGPVDRPRGRDGEARRLRIAAVQHLPLERRQVEGADGVPAAVLAGEARGGDLGEEESPARRVEGDASRGGKAAEDDLPAAVRREVVDRPLLPARPVEVAAGRRRDGRPRRAGLLERRRGTAEDQDRTGVPDLPGRTGEVDLVVRTDRQVLRRRAEENGRLGSLLGHQPARGRVHPVEASAAAHREGLRDRRAVLEEGPLAGGEIDPGEGGGRRGETLPDDERSLSLESDAGGVRESRDGDPFPGLGSGGGGDRFDCMTRKR